MGVAKTALYPAPAGTTDARCQVFPPSPETCTSSFFTAGRHQMFTVVFRVDRWSGTLAEETDETVAACFFDRSELPELRPAYVETLQDLDRYDGTLILK